VRTDDGHVVSEYQADAEVTHQQRNALLAGDRRVEQQRANRQEKVGFR